MSGPGHENSHRRTGSSLPSFRDEAAMFNINGNLQAPPVSVCGEAPGEIETFL